MAKDSHSRTATVLGKPLACLVCGGREFYRRTIKMNTTGMSLLDLDAFNKGADTAICGACGFLHSFASKTVEWSAK